MYRETEYTSIYEAPLWGMLQELQEKGSADVFRYSSEKMEIRYPFIRRTAGIVDGVQYYDIVTARGECGPIVTVKQEMDADTLREEMGQYMSALDAFLQKERVVAEFIRFSPWRNAAKLFENHYQLRPYGQLYQIDLNEDFFMKSFDTKMRNLIRKASKMGVEIRIDRTGESMDDFMELYAFTADKNNMSAYYRIDSAFLRRYFDVLRGSVSIYNAMFEGKLVSSAVMLDSPDIRHYHFSANHPEYMHCQGNSLILYTAAMDGKESGKQLMDLGGATPGSGLEKYKKQFVREPGYYPYDVGTRVVCQEIYDRLVEQAGGARPNYFPAYRR